MREFLQLQTHWFIYAFMCGKHQVYSVANKRTFSKETDENSMDLIDQLLNPLGPQYNISTKHSNVWENKMEDFKETFTSLKDFVSIFRNNF